MVHLADWVSKLAGLYITKLFYFKPFQYAIFLALSPQFGEPQPMACFQKSWLWMLHTGMTSWK